jgi:DNA helicase-2/ATP-dependent DNA helicase PcrA
MSNYPRSLEQLEVIGHPQRPLRVAAGAGTGKTATMSDRLVAVIDAGVAPEAALGITFTNKAAEELADRLRASLPGFAVEGREVEVTTYHGFAYRLLQEFGAFVGVEHDVEVIGPGYVRQLLFESLEGASYGHLDLTAPAQRVAEAATLASQLGDNLLTSSELSVFAPTEHDAIWAQRIELGGIVARYERAKRDLGVADYADLIRSPIESDVVIRPWCLTNTRTRLRLRGSCFAPSLVPGFRSRRSVTPTRQFTNGVAHRSGTSKDSPAIFRPRMAPQPPP